MASRGLVRNNRSLLEGPRHPSFSPTSSEIYADSDVKGSREFGLAEVLSTPSSLRAQRSNPGPQHAAPWIASSQGLLAMTANGVIHVPQLDFLNSGRRLRPARFRTAHMDGPRRCAPAGSLVAELAERGQCGEDREQRQGQREADETERAPGERPADGAGQKSQHHR